MFKPTSNWYLNRNPDLNINTAYPLSLEDALKLDWKRAYISDSVPKSMLGLHKDSVSLRLRNSEKDKYTTHSTFYCKV